MLFIYESVSIIVTEQLGQPHEVPLHTRIILHQIFCVSSLRGS